MSPTVEGMKQAHRLFFIIRRTAFHNRADQHFQQSASERIDRNRNQKSRIGAWQQFRQHGKSEQSGRSKNMGKHNRNPVTDFIHKSCRQQVHQKLDAEINSDQHRDLPKRNVVCTLKGQKQ